MAVPGRLTGLKKIPPDWRNRMSKMCGDTARFNRIRKQRTRTRARIRELSSQIAARKGPPAGAVEKPKT
jgi:hypothetical protein